MLQFCHKSCSWDLTHKLSFLSIYRIPGWTPYYRIVSLTQLHIFLYSSNDFAQSRNTNSTHQKQMRPISFPTLLISLHSVTVKLQSSGNTASHSFISQCTENASNTCIPFQNSLQGSLDASINFTIFMYIPLWKCYTKLLFWSIIGFLKVHVKLTFVIILNIRYPREFLTIYKFLFTSFLKLLCKILKWHAQQTKLTLTTSIF